MFVPANQILFPTSLQHSIVALPSQQAYLAETTIRQSSLPSLLEAFWQRQGYVLCATIMWCQIVLYMLYLVTVTSFSMYNYPHFYPTETSLHHTQSMPSMSPCPLKPKSELSHSASDIPFVLDEAERFSCDSKRKQSLTLSDLEFVQLIGMSCCKCLRLWLTHFLGTGMYSKVYLVQSKAISRDYFALKIIPKYKLKHKKVRSEADIMLSLDHPLIVKTYVYSR